MNSDNTVQSPGVTRDQIEKVRSRKIFFGHQSVGAGIVQGLAEISENDFGAPLTIVRTSEPVEGTGGYFAHDSIGKNYYPETKLEGFARTMRAGMGADVDIALMKFCYLDIQEDSDVEKLFADYRDTVQALKEEYPDTIFVHVTAPLLTEERGFKALVKKVIGRPLRGYLDNLARHKFNELIRNEAGRTDPVFDLAALEATALDGTVWKRSYRDEEYLVFNPAYTYDHGHLNELGKRVIGERFISFLAGL